MCKPPRRRPFVLIEVIIATTLFILMLTAVFGIFWRTAKTTNSLNKLRIANEQLLVTQAKLQSTFSKVLFKKRYNPYFYIETDGNSSQPALIFTVDNLVQTSAELSGIVLTKLYVEDEQLMLATFPHIQEGLPELMEKEALLSKVTNFKVELFLAPEPSKEAADEETTKKPPQGSWTDRWPKEYNQAPTLIKLTITKRSAGTFSLWFMLPEMVNTVLYEKG